MFAFGTYNKQIFIRDERSNKNIKTLNVSKMNIMLCVSFFNMELGSFWRNYTFAIYKGWELFIFRRKKGSEHILLGFAHISNYSKLSSQV